MRKPQKLATVRIQDSNDQTHIVEIWDEANCKLNTEQIMQLMEDVKMEATQNESVDCDIELIIRKKIEPSKSMTAKVYLPYYNKTHGYYKNDLEIVNWGYVSNDQ